MVAKRRKTALRALPRPIPLLAAALGDRLAGLTRAPTKTQAHRGEHREIPQRRRAFVVFGLGLLLGGERPQVQSRLRAEALACELVGFLISDVEPRHLPHAHALAGEAAHESFAMLGVGPGQGYEQLRRRLYADLAHADRVLHRFGQCVDQRESAADPARRSIQASRELGLHEPVVIAELTQQPAFLEGRALAAIVEPVREHQRLGLGHVEHRDLDEVAREHPQRRDADVAVDQDPARAVAHDDHRRLLPVLEQRRDQPTRAALVRDPQRLVAQVQLGELELHRPSTLGRSAAGGDAILCPAFGVSGEFPSDFKDLSVHCISHPVAHYFAGFLNDYGKFRSHCVLHGRETKSGRRRARALRDRLPQPATQTVGLLLGRVLAAPARTRSAVPLSLALVVAAHALAITGAWVRQKPPTADPARALAEHPRERRPGRPRPPNRWGAVTSSSKACSSGRLVALGFVWVGHFSRAEAGHFWRAPKLHGGKHR